MDNLRSQTGASFAHKDKLPGAITELLKWAIAEELNKSEQGGIEAWPC